jgi:osmotically inducible protein OsmC
MAARIGSAVWNGDLVGGSGKLTVGEGGWQADYSFVSRFKGLLTDGDGEEVGATNPEELLATAHAACFSMALSLALTEAGHAPTSIETTARLHLRNLDGLPTIARIELDTEADVPDIDETEFAAKAEEARATCILSRALGGVSEIELDATLGTQPGLPAR